MKKISSVIAFLFVACTILYGLYIILTFAVIVDGGYVTVSINSLIVLITLTIISGILVLTCYKAVEDGMNIVQDFFEKLCK